MKKLTKFLIGVGGTSLLAWGAHALTGDGYITGLESKAVTALSANGISNVKLVLGRDPLTRVAELSGITDPAARQRAELAVMAIPGISGVRWAGDAMSNTQVGAAAKTSAALTTAAANSLTSDDTAAACQASVDSAMAGKVINFKSGSAYMPASSLSLIETVANAIRDCAGVKIAVEGHTDATGSNAINQSLSQARADVVSAALIERGIAADRISATGFGSTRPTTPGNAADATNRRIEFKLGNGSAQTGSGPSTTQAGGE